MERKIIEDWNQLSLRQFVEICEMQADEPDPEKFTPKVIEYLYGCDPMQIPYTEYLAMIAGLNKFLDKSVTGYKVTKNLVYSINGTEYVLDTNPSGFTTAQYMDFMSFSKNGGRYVDTLSTVLIPKGHLYNDGYDIDKAKEDIASMPVDSALGVVCFFKNWSKRYIGTILRFLTSRRMLKKVSKEKRKELRKEVRRLTTLLESFRMY